MSPADKAWIAVALVLAGYEAWALLYNATHKGKPDHTLSEAVWEAVTKRPLIPFLAGGLSTHFFGELHTWGTAIPFTIAIAYLLWDLFEKVRAK